MEDIKRNVKDVNEFPVADKGELRRDVELYDKTAKKDKGVKVKVIRKTRKSETGVSVDGFGVMLDTPGFTYDVGDEVEVHVKGKIGTKEFEIEAV